MKTLLCLGLVVLGSSASAAPLPAGCTRTGIDVQGDHLQLSTDAPVGSQRVYLLHNKSKDAVTVNHPSDRPMSAGWATRLDAGKWSALALEEANFTLTCAGTSATKPCKEVLQVCAIAEPAMTAEARGSYWLAENQELARVFMQMRARGVEVPRS